MTAAAAASRNGPVPASRTRCPSATRSQAARCRACPGVTTPGSCQLGNGMARSYPPVATIRARARTWTVASAPVSHASRVSPSSSTPQTTCPVRQRTPASRAAAMSRVPSGPVAVAGQHRAGPPLVVLAAESRWPPPAAPRPRPRRRAAWRPWRRPRPAAHDHDVAVQPVLGGGWRDGGFRRRHGDPPLLDAQPGADVRHAGPAAGHVVDGQLALEADAHPAERAARLSGHRVAAQHVHSGLMQRARDALAR